MMADSTCSSADALSERFTKIFGARFRLIFDQGDYELIARVEFSSGNLVVQIAVPKDHGSNQDYDIFIKGPLDDNLKTDLETHLRASASSVPVSEIDTIFTEASKWIEAHAPTVSQCDSPGQKQQKPCKKKRSTCPPDEATGDQSSNRKPGMKTASDVIARLQWDASLPRNHFSVGYIDRFVGILEKPFDDFNWRDSFVDVDLMTDFAIPQHRIQYFKYKTAKVWDKTERIDAIFNSVGPVMSLEEIVRKEDEKDQLQEFPENHDAQNEDDK